MRNERIDNLSFQEAMQKALGFARCAVGNEEEFTGEFRRSYDGYMLFYQRRSDNAQPMSPMIHPSVFFKKTWYWRTLGPVPPPRVKKSDGVATRYVNEVIESVKRNSRKDRS